MKSLITEITEIKELQTRMLNILKKEYNDLLAEAVDMYGLKDTEDAKWKRLGGMDRDWETFWFVVL